MLSAFIGLIFVVFSLWGLIVWRQDFLIVMKGLLPISFIMGGCVAIIAGIASWIEQMKKK